MLNGIWEGLFMKKAETDKVLPISADSRKSVAAHQNREKYWNAVKKGARIGRLKGFVRKNILQRILQGGKLLWQTRFQSDSAER